MKATTIALALTAVAAGGFTAVGEYFYRFALTQKIDKASVINAPHNRPVSTAKSTFKEDIHWLTECVQTEAWQLISHDGLQLNGICLCRNNSAPWAVLCHGYTAHAATMAEYARGFYNAGFNVLMPDARCHGKSGGEYIGMGWPERHDLINWVLRINQEYSTPDIVLMGVSMGAATVMMAAGEALPQNVRVIIEDCGYTTAWDEFSYQLKKLYKLPAFPVLYAADMLLKRRAGFSLRDASALKQVAKSKTPILFIHGGKDAFVPFEMQQQLYNAASCPKELFANPSAGHAESRRINPERYWERVFCFIGSYMHLPQYENTKAL